MLYKKSSRQRSPNSLHNAGTHDTQPNRSALDRIALVGRLHESLAQDLALLGYRIDELIADPSLAPHHRSELREIRLSLLSITHQFRDDIYLTNQRSRAWLQRAIEEALGHISLDIDLSYPLLKERYETLLNEALYEITRNALRHSQARNFSINFRLDDTFLEIIVEDDGQGFENIRNSNLGLRLIDQTLKAISHQYSCTSTTSGTVYRITIDTSFLENVNMA